MERARELIEDAAIIPTAMVAVVRIVSSDGLRVPHDAERLHLPGQQGVFPPRRRPHGDRVMAADTADPQQFLEDRKNGSLEL